MRDLQGSAVEWFIEPLSQPFMQRVLLAGVLAVLTTVASTETPPSSISNERSTSSIGRG